MLLGPGIVRRALITVDPGAAESKLHRAGLPQQHHPSSPQLVDDGRVLDRDIAVVARPRTSMMSFAANGIPCSGPASYPERNDNSDARAASRAIARGINWNAPSAGFRASARSSKCSIKVTGESDPS